MHVYIMYIYYIYIYKYCIHHRKGGILDWKLLVFGVRCFKYQIKTGPSRCGSFKKLETYDLGQEFAYRDVDQPAIIRTEATMEQPTNNSKPLTNNKQIISITTHNVTDRSPYSMGNVARKLPQSQDTRDSMKTVLSSVST